MPPFVSTPPRDATEVSPVAGFPWAPPPAPFLDPNGETADNDDRERHYFYNTGPDGPLILKCQAHRICIAKDYRLFQTKSERFKKDYWDECEEDGTETVVMLWDDWNGYRGENVMVKKTAVLCKRCADLYMKSREERRCQNPKRPDCLMLAIECEEGMREFGAALKQYGPRLCFRCVSEYAPPKSTVPVSNPNKKNDPEYVVRNWQTATFAPVRPPDDPPA